jgi:GDPmannose 4,6-dehydratase
MSNPKTALICGISGQDGAFLAQLLLQKGYLVHGASRDAHANSFGNLKSLGIFPQIQQHSMTITDFRSVSQALRKVQPDEIYNLAGQSSVGLSFEQPVETLESIAHGTLVLLEAMRFLELPARLYNAGSGDCFGDTGEDAADETTPFHPRSPYAVAKAAAFWEVANYRESYGLFACTGILFNHESPLRPPRFVTRKITAAAARIAAGSSEKLELGNLDICRDWGWAAEYVDAMWRMLQQPAPQDFVLATGASYRLLDFVEQAFACRGLDWRQHTLSNPTLLRPTDIPISRANPAKAAEILGWRAKYQMPEVARMMVEAERRPPG